MGQEEGKQEEETEITKLKGEKKGEMKGQRKKRSRRS